jgi:hypothetical protein
MTNVILKRLKFRVEAIDKLSQMRTAVLLNEGVNVKSMYSNISGAVRLFKMLQILFLKSFTMLSKFCSLSKEVEGKVNGSQAQVNCKGVDEILLVEMRKKYAL